MKCSFALRKTEDFRISHPGEAAEFSVHMLNWVNKCEVSAWVSKLGPCRLFISTSG